MGGAVLGRKKNALNEKVGSWRANGDWRGEWI